MSFSLLLNPPCAGQDRAFRAFSTIQDAQSRELSQHHTARRAKRLKIEEKELKLAPVLALDACDVSAGRCCCCCCCCCWTCRACYWWRCCCCEAAVGRLPGTAPQNLQPGTAPRLQLFSTASCLNSPIFYPYLPARPQVRERDWSNVITAHEDDTRAYVWRLQKYTLGEWVSGHLCPALL